MSKLWVMGLVAVCLMAAGGCRKSSESLAEKLAEKAIEKNSGGKADVDISNGKITVKTKDGEMVATSGGSATVPADFPKDVLILKDAKMLATIKVPDGFSITMESKETPENIVKKYAADMKANGWSEAVSMNTGDGMMLGYSKEKEKRSANVMVAKADKGSQIILTVAKSGSAAADDASADDTANE